MNEEAFEGNEKEVIRKFIKASAWVLASNIGAKGLNFILLNVLARMLNPTGFGLYNAIIASAASVNQICDVGSTMVLQRSSARLQEQSHEKTGSRLLIIFFVQFVLNLLFTIAILIFPDFFDQLLFHNSISNLPITLIGLIAIMQITFQVPLTMVLGFGEYKRYAVRMIISNFIALILTLAMLLIFGVTIRHALWALVIAFLINSAWSWIMLNQILKRKQVPIKLIGIKRETASVFKEGFIYYVGNILGGAIFNILLIRLFSKYIGIEEFGHLRIATALVVFISIIPAAFQSVNLTFLTRNEQAGFGLKSMQLRLISVACFLISIVLICYINFLIRLFFGAAYLEGREIFIFVILLNIIVVISSVIISFLVASGHGPFVGIISSIGVFLNIVACLLLIPRIGIYGFYIGQLIGFGFGFLVVLIKEFKKYHYPDIKILRKLAVILTIGLSGLLPVLMVHSGCQIEIYKVLYIFGMIVITIPLAINQQEWSRLIELLKNKMQFIR